jgi:site-specific DNA-cytosine methylase
MASQIGESVPPLLGKVIAESILKANYREVAY